jgi:hypothetical protein
MCDNCTVSPSSQSASQSFGNFISNHKKLACNLGKFLRNIRSSCTSQSILFRKKYDVEIFVLCLWRNWKECRKGVAECTRSIAEFPFLFSLFLSCYFLSPFQFIFFPNSSRITTFL